MERAGAVATYREYSDAADAGTLSEGEIAEALHAGFITPGKARTLAAKRDKSLKPVIEDVMAPVKDAGSKGGRRPSEVKTSIAEEAAAIWAARNPGATLDERLKAGAAIAQRVYGAPKSTPGPTPNDSPAKQGKFDALKAQHRAGKLDNSTYLRRIQELNSHAH